MTIIGLVNRYVDGIVFFGGGITIAAIVRYFFHVGLC
jgi:hypothetical protein